MTFFEKEFRRMFEDNPVLRNFKVSGKMLYGTLDGGNLVKIKFSTSMIANQYDRLIVKIMNRFDGEIDTESFRFQDIIGNIKGRSGELYSPHIWLDGDDAYWYVPITDSQREKIADAVLDYMAMFQEQGMTM